MPISELMHGTHMENDVFSVVYATLGTLRLTLLGFKSKVCSGKQSRLWNCAFVASELDNLGKLLVLSETAFFFVE